MELKEVLCIVIVAPFVITACGLGLILLGILFVNWGFPVDFDWQSFRGAWALAQGILHFCCLIAVVES